MAYVHPAYLRFQHIYVKLNTILSVKMKQHLIQIQPMKTMDSMVVEWCGGGGGRQNVQRGAPYKTIARR